MYSTEIIRKAVKSLYADIRKYDKMDISEIKLCVSKGNMKIGHVLNVSLPPVISCGNCAECKKLCYDIKAVIQYPNVTDARARNYSLLKKDIDEYFRQIDDACSRRRKNKYFRYHVAGDITSLEYLDNMVKIARKHPDFRFWTYTKMYSLVNMYVAAHGDSIAAAIPSNLVIMFSEWRGMPMNNRYGFPEFKVVFKDETPPAGFYCPGNCDACKANNTGCIYGKTVYCHEH